MGLKSSEINLKCVGTLIFINKPSCLRYLNQYIIILRYIHVDCYRYLFSKGH